MRPTNFQLIAGYWFDPINETEALYIKEYDMPPVCVYGLCLLDLGGRQIPIGIAVSLEQAKAKMQEYSDDFYTFTPCNQS